MFILLAHSALDTKSCSSFAFELLFGYQKSKTLVQLRRARHIDCKMMAPEGGLRNFSLSVDDQCSPLVCKSQGGPDSKARPSLIIASCMRQEDIVQKSKGCLVHGPVDSVPDTTAGISPFLSTNGYSSRERACPGSQGPPKLSAAHASRVNTCSTY